MSFAPVISASAFARNPAIMPAPQMPKPRGYWDMDATYPLPKTSEGKSLKDASMHFRARAGIQPLMCHDVG